MMYRPCIPDLGIMFKIYEVNEQKISEHSDAFSRAFLEHAMFENTLHNSLYDVQSFINQTRQNIARFDASKPTELQIRFVKPLRDAVDITQDILDSMARKRDHELSLWGCLAYLPVSIENVPESRKTAFASAELALKNAVDQILAMLPYWRAEGLINSFRANPIFMKPELQDFGQMAQAVIKPRLARAKKKAPV